MGSKGSQTVQSQSGTSSYNANPATYGAGTQALGMAQNAANQPFNLPQAPVAGFQPDQLQAFQQYRDLQGMAQPYYNQAQGLFNQSAAPITAAQTNNYMNPYASYVLGNLRESQGQQMNDLTGRLTQAAGGVGADRIAVGQGELARQQNLATGQTLSGIYGSALSAAQQDAQRQQASAYGIGNLGGAAQNAAIQGSQTLLGAGNQQQAQQQNLLNSPYYNQLAQIAYPYQNAQFLAGITGGLAGALGGTTSTQGTKITQPPTPSIWSQLLGAGTTAVGGLGASGAFGNNGWLTGNGGTATTTDAGDGSGATGKAADGGRIYPGYADGGGVFNPAQADASWLSANPTIPKIDMQPAQVNQPKVDLQWGDDKASSGSGGTDWLKTAGDVAKIAMMFANRGGRIDYADGGAVMPGMGMNYDDGGEVPLYPGIYRMQGSPKDYADWQRSADVANGAGGSGSDDGETTLPLNATPTGGGNPKSGGPYAGISTAADDTAQANARDMDQRTFQMPYGDLNHTQDVSRKFAKDPWMALIAAGAGMMGGDSPYAGINIGKGLTAGVNYLGEQRKASREEEGVNQRAKQLALEAEKHRDSMTRLTPAQAATIQDQKERRKLEETRLDVQGWQKGETTATGDTTFFKPATKESGVLKADGTWIQKNAPQDESSTATQPPVPPPPVPVPPPVPPKEAEPEAKTAISPPGGTVAQRSPDEMIARPKEVGKAAERDDEMLQSYATKGMAQQGRSAANLERKEVVKLSTGADRSQFRLQEMKRDLDTIMAFVNKNPSGPMEKALQMAIKPGPGADTAANIANWMSKFGGGLPPEVLSAVQTWGKNATFQGFSGIVAEGLSAREAQPIIRASMNAVANIGIPEASNRALIASGEELAQRAKDKRAFFDQYIAKNGGLSTGWEEQFEKKFPLSGYITRAVVASLPAAEKAKLAPDTQLLRQRRDEFMEAEKSGDQNAIAAARDKYTKVRGAFNLRYGGTADYFAFGRM